MTLFLFDACSYIVLIHTHSTDTEPSLINHILFYILQETLVNSTDGGKLSIQLRNKRYAAKKDEKNDVIASSPLSGGDAKDALEMLKSMVVNESNMHEFKRLLSLTLEYRQTKLQSEEELNLQEYFPYFFVSTELVSFLHLFIQ